MYKQICLKNKCVNSEIAPVKTCVFNDQLIFQEYFDGKYFLPYTPMSCDSYLEYAYSNLLYDDYSTCSNPFIRDQCCNSCKSKLSLASNKL